MRYELRILIIFCIAVTLLTTAIPFDASAAGLIPCGGGSPEPPCQPCHIFSLIQKILNFIWQDLALPIAILMFAYGGFLMIIPGVGGEKSVSMYTKGKKVLTNAVFGILIIFLAWLAVDTIIKALGGKMATNTNIVTVTRFGQWNKIKCEIK